MHIAIDGYEANIPRRVGIGRYAYEILHAMYAITARKKEFERNTFTVYVPTPPLPDLPGETPWWRYRLAKPKSLWTFFGLPAALTADTSRADVVFSPTHYVPRFVDMPKVMAIMDLSYLVYPQMFRKQDLHKLTHWTAYSTRHAQRILTISEHSKDAIIHAYHIQNERVVVTYPGVTMQQATSRESDVKKKYALPERYILAVGTLQPRKNYVRLIEAFAILTSSLPDVRLVIVGKKGWLYQEILDAPKKFGIADRVMFLHDVTDIELPVLYANAQCFVLVSLYEGFGFPVLEAMHAKCPVVASDVSSLPEVVGDAGILVDPENVRSIAEGIARALTPQARDLVKKGLLQVKKFSWEKAARQTLAVLEEVGRSEK